MDLVLPKRIGVLIPTTSGGRPEWKNVTDTYLFNYTLRSFLHTRSPQHQYTFYIGVDNNDRIFSHLSSRAVVHKLKTYYPGTSYKFISMDKAKKGHLTKMWNILFKYAYDEGCDYFLQCGDDINFKSKYWIDDAIHALEKNNGVGITAPICNNPAILTQSFVSRKHMEIFGWFFPEEIVNWFCDNWINAIYKPNHYFPLHKHYCSNDGGGERYTVGSTDLPQKKGVGMDFLENLKKPDRHKEDLDKLCAEAQKLASKHKELLKSHLPK